MNLPEKRTNTFFVAAAGPSVRLPCPVSAAARACVLNPQTHSITRIGNKIAVARLGNLLVILSLYHKRPAKDRCLGRKPVYDEQWCKCRLRIT